jgi:hypothetical protein
MATKTPTRASRRENGKPRPKKRSSSSLPGHGAGAEQEDRRRLAETYHTEKLDEWQAAHKPMMDQPTPCIETAMKEAKLTSYELPDGLRGRPITASNVKRSARCARSPTGGEDDEF